MIAKRTLASNTFPMQNHFTEGVEMKGHVARRTQMDHVLSSSATSGATPRSSSWSREHPGGGLAQSARTPRSKSMSRPKPKESSEDDKERRDNAQAAFREWLKRKTVEPRTPRASPSRDQITRHLKDEARQRVINEWHNHRRFQKKSSQDSDTKETNN